MGMRVESKRSKASTKVTLTIQVSREQIISAVHSWSSTDLEMLIEELQSVAQIEAIERQERAEQMQELAEAERKQFSWSDEELEAMKWQTLAEKYHLLEWLPPLKIASLAEISSVIPEDVPAPSDEEVKTMLMPVKL
jgi:hypothetical protein